MMKIAIEAQRIFRPHKHGMDFVVLETIRELQRMDHDNQYYILVSPGEDRCLQETDNFHIVEVNTPSYPLWEQVGLPRALKHIHPDLLHCTSNTAPLRCNVPLVLTLHDIIFLEKRDSSNKSLYQNLGWYYRRFDVPRILPKCTKVITVSDFERQNILEKTGLSADKIVTIHNGYSDYFHQIENCRKAVNRYVPEGKKYFFFLGNTDPRKNTKRVLKAFTIYVQRTEHPAILLITGLKREIVDEYLKEEGIESIAPYIQISGYIDTDDMAAIYNGAEIFLYPSLREGFGIPVLEAMACGTPVITSNISSIPEIAGEGAILVNPYDEEEIAAQLLKIETDADYRQAQIAYGLERVKQFSWEQTARRVLEIYRQVVK